MEHKAVELKDRTKSFTLRIMRMIRTLPSSPESRMITHQLLRSGTSVAANYRAVCRARSRAEFLSKLGVVIEEADESACGNFQCLPDDCKEGVSFDNQQSKINNWEES